MTTTIIDDVLQPNLRVVFCGTALGNASAMAKAYYAHPRNLFWDTLHEIGLTWADAPLLPHEYRRALDFGIGLTDLCKSASGNDADLPPGAFDVHALREKIDQCRPLFLAFTSKRAGRAFCGSKVELSWQQLRPNRISTSPSRSLSGLSSRAPSHEIGVSKARLVAGVFESTRTLIQVLPTVNFATHVVSGAVEQTQQQIAALKRPAAERARWNDGPHSSRTQSSYLRDALGRALETWRAPILRRCWMAL